MSRTRWPRVCDIAMLKFIAKFHKEHTLITNYDSIELNYLLKFPCHNVALIFQKRNSILLNQRRNQTLKMSHR